MPPSRSPRASSRFDPLSEPSPSSSVNAQANASSSRRVQRSTTVQPIEVIEISSDEDDDDAVIVVSEDDEIPLQPMKRLNLKDTRPIRPPKSPKPTHDSSHTQPARPKDAVRSGAAEHGPVTIARILAGEFGDPKTWSFGLPEANFVDIEKLIEESFKHPLMNYDQAGREQFRARMRSLNPKAFGASYLHLFLHFAFFDPHADITGSSRRERPHRPYTHVERYPGGPVWFTVRWWAAGNLGTYFDLVDVATRKLFLPHRDLPDLFVQIEALGGMMAACTIEEAMRRSRGVKKIPGANDDERYCAPEGARVLFSRILPNGKKEPVADVFSPRDRPIPPLGPQPSTFSPFD